MTDDQSTIVRHLHFVVWVPHALSEESEKQENQLGNRHQVLLQHDNARTQSLELKKAIILAPGWEVLPHAPYFPDLVP